jgi:hypothetical protein
MLNEEGLREAARRVVAGRGSTALVGPETGQTGDWNCIRARRGQFTSGHEGDGGARMWNAECRMKSTGEKQKR